MNVLLNAEPYGFGPSAAAASFAEGLLRGEHAISFAAEGHALDLHRNLPYAAVYDMTGETDSAWRDLISRHDALFTATDWRISGIGLDAGIPVAFYDPLTWYWDELPPAATRGFYLAQDFIGVRQRLAVAAPSGIVVPPICSRHPFSGDGGTVLLNLGGLHNPLWGSDDAVAYAMAVITAVRSVLPPGHRLEVAASSAVARAAASPDVRPHDAAEMAGLFRKSAFAIMTSGLGNIYEAAATGIPVCWLPPANDSHARQLSLLKEEGMADVYLSWEDLGLLPCPRGTQPEVTAVLAKNVAMLSGSGPAGMLRSGLSSAVVHLISGRGTGASRLLVLFGSNGGPSVVGAVTDWLSCLPKTPGCST
jgi:hypothetical protein